MVACNRRAQRMPFQFLASACEAVVLKQTSLAAQNEMNEDSMVFLCCIELCDRALSVVGMGAW